MAAKRKEVVDDTAEKFSRLPKCSVFECEAKGHIRLKTSAGKADFCTTHYLNYWSEQLKRA